VIDRKIIKELKERNPYPEDIFLEKKQEDWAEFHTALRKRHLAPDGFMGSFGRKVWNNCILELEKIMREE